MRVEVEGLAKLVNQLEKFSPEVSKVLKADLRKGASKVAGASKGLIPSDTALSGWGKWTDSETDRGLDFIGSWARSQVSVQANRYRRSGVTTSFGYSVISKNPGAAIFETAGPGNRTRGEAGRRFVRNVNRKHGSKPLPRTLYPAYENVTIADRSPIGRRSEGAQHAADE